MERAFAPKPSAGLATNSMAPAAPTAPAVTVTPNVEPSRGVSSFDGANQQRAEAFTPPPVDNVSTIVVSRAQQNALNAQESMAQLMGGANYSEVRVAPAAQEMLRNPFGDGPRGAVGQASAEPNTLSAAVAAAGGAEGFWHRSMRNVDAY